jgi:heptose I phosphotransferase
MLMLPEQWLKRWQGQDIFTQIFSLPGTVYREQPGRKTFRYENGGENYFIKLHYGVGWLEIFKNLIQGRLPVLGAKNEFQAITRLQDLGITATIVGYGWRGHNPATQQSFIITKELLFTTTLEDFCGYWLINKPSFALKTGLTRRVANISRNMHTRGINHRDFYLCHFLLDMTGGPDLLCPDNLTLYLIDLHRAQVRKKVPFRWRVKDIGGLYFSALDIGLTRKDIFRFMKNYAQMPLKDTLKNDKQFWQKAAYTAIKLYKKIHKKNPQLPSNLTL